MTMNDRLPAATDYRADIDGLRAVAVLSVMLYHLNAHWLPGGFVGVDIFFVISGFVVSASLTHAPSDRFHRFVAFFYARRLLRIGPALVLVLLTSVLAASLFIPRAWLSEFNERTALYAFFGLSNWVLQTNADTYFAPRAEFNPYTHTWSLGVEEQFYLAFPFLFFAWVKLRDSKRGRVAATAALALLGTASLAACVWATKQMPAAAFYGIAFRFWELAVGVLLFQLTANRSEAEAPHRGNVPQWLVGAAPWLGATVIAASFALVDATAFPWFWALPPVLAAAAIIGGCNANVEHPVRRLLAHPVAVWIGKRSYSLYLWHWPVFVLLRWTTGLDDFATRAAALLLSFVLATLAYRWVELPVRQHRGLARLSPAMRIGVLLAMIVLGWGAARLILTQQRHLSLSTVARNADEWYVTSRMPAQLMPPETSTRRCEVGVRYRALAGGQVISFEPARCPNVPKPLNGKLSVIGDSHATAYLPLFDQLSAELGVKVNVYTYPGCAFVDLRMPMNIGRGPGCVAFAREAAAEVARDASPSDVLFLASLRQPRFADQWAAFDQSEVLAVAQSDTLRQWSREARDEATKLLHPVLAAGVKVLFDAPKPVFLSPTFRCADWFNRGNPVCRGGLQQTHSSLENLRAPVMDSISAVASGNPAIAVWDSLPLLCPEATCSALHGQHPLFFDGDHLSAYGNARLYPAFRSTVTALMTTGR